MFCVLVRSFGAAQVGIDIRLGPSTGVFVYSIVAREQSSMASGRLHSRFLLPLPPHTRLLRLFRPALFLFFSGGGKKSLRSVAAAVTHRRPVVTPTGRPASVAFWLAAAVSSTPFAGSVARTGTAWRFDSCPGRRDHHHGQGSWRVITAPAGAREYAPDPGVKAGVGIKALFVRAPPLSKTAPALAPQMERLLWWSWSRFRKCLAKQLHLLD